MAMVWQPDWNAEPKTVCELYHSVFGDKISKEDLGAELGSTRLHLLLVRREDDLSPVAFGVFHGRGSDVKLRYGGVIASQRRQGAGTFLLESAERYLAEQGYSRLTVTAYNRWNIMLSLLIRRGYLVEGTEYSARREDMKIRLYRPLRVRRELRLALTDRCNFRCFFCHNEGLPADQKKEKPSIERNLEVLERALALGYSDLTLTGGEPLLEKERLGQILAWLATRDERPAVTVVTNGWLLDERAIEVFKTYPAPLKLNVSLHASDSNAFRQVTRTEKPDGFARVTANIRSATAAGLTVKINHVVLQGVNHRREQVLQTIELARALGAQAVKFLELLVVSKNAEDFRWFYDIDAVRRHVESVGVQPEQRSRRQLVYLHREDPSFAIELQQCTCRLGCAYCLELRDRTISNQLCYHPCFVLTDRGYEILDASALDEVFRDGDRIIDGYAARYGTSSPTLQRQEQYVAGRTDVFFRVEDGERFVRFLRERGLKQTAAARFHEEYYRPRGCRRSWLRYERVLKLGWDLHDQEKVELIQTDHSYTVREAVPGRQVLETESRFLYESGPLAFEGIERPRRLLDRLDFEWVQELDWELCCFRTGAQQGRLELSVALGADRCTVRAPGPTENLGPLLALLDEYEGEIQPLMVPLMEYMSS